MKVFACCVLLALGNLSAVSANNNAKSSIDSSVAQESNKAKSSQTRNIDSANIDLASPNYSEINKAKSSQTFSPKSNAAFGVFGNFGSMMGGGLEVSFCIYCSEVWQVRNAISLEAKGIKLRSNSYDTFALIAHEKVIFATTLGSSLASRIGLAFFRPYLHISAGFGLLDYGGFLRHPYYYEAQGGIGHEFISLKGHSAFFEVGGGIAKLTHNVPNTSAKSGLGGIFKVLLGMRFYF